jgi:hypothetical protein
MFRQEVNAQVQWGARTFPRSELIQSVTNVSDCDIHVAKRFERQMCGISAGTAVQFGHEATLYIVFVSTLF